MILPRLTQGWVVERAYMLLTKKRLKSPLDDVKPKISLSPARFDVTEHTCPHLYAQ